MSDISELNYLQGLLPYGLRLGVNFKDEGMWEAAVLETTEGGVNGVPVAVREWSRVHDIDALQAAREAVRVAFRQIAIEKIADHVPPEIGKPARPVVGCGCGYCLSRRDQGTLYASIGGKIVPSLSLLPILGAGG